MKGLGLLALVWATTAGATSWFPLTIDLSLSQSFAALPSSAVVLSAGRVFGGPHLGAKGGFFWAPGGEASVERVVRSGQLFTSVGPQLRAGWAWPGPIEEDDVLPKVALGLRLTPFLTTSPLATPTEADRFAQQPGPFLGLRLGVGVTASAWTAACFDAAGDSRDHGTRATAPPRDHEPMGEQRHNPAYDSTSRSDGSVFSCLWCFVNHLEVFTEAYGPRERPQWRFGVRLGGGL